MAAHQDTGDLILATRLHRLGAAARAADQAAQDARDARDTAIEDASLQGHSTRWIAGHTGLSPSAVQDVVIRRTAARQARLTHAAGL